MKVDLMERVNYLKAKAHGANEALKIARKESIKSRIKDSQTIEEIKHILKDVIEVIL